MLSIKSLFKRFNTAQTLAALFTALLVATPCVNAQKAEQILARQPTQKVDVDYPSDDEAEKCVVKRFEESGYTGVALYKPDGVTLLRVWAAPPPKEGQRAQVEQCRYYKNGIEVFRDVNNKEARWFNTGGTRRGALAADRKTIESWTVLSAQEATQEAIAALKTNDFPRYQRVALSAQELQGLKLTGAAGTEIANQVKGVTAAAFAKLAASFKFPEDAVWGALNAGTPATVPSGAVSAEDLDVIYNAAVVVMTGQGEEAQSQEYFIGDIVRIGSTWKIVGLPVGEPFGAATGAVAASSVLIPTSGEANADGSATAEIGEMGTALSDAYRKLETASPQEYPELCEQTVQLLLNIASSNPQERDNMLAQAIDVVFGGVQSGVYPAGAKKLAELADTLGDASPEVKARLRQRQITADWLLVSQAQPQPKPAELNKAQEKYSEDLASLVEEFPNTTAGAEAAMTLALDQEYMLDNDAAAKYYQQAAQTAGSSPIGQRARGALARIKSEGGKPSLPAMQYFGGGAVDLNALKGKPTIVFVWGSWDAQSVDAVKRLANQVNVIGVNIDSAPDPAQATAYFQQITKGLPWKNVCDPAGLDGAPAIGLGVMTAPWVILIDKDGNVVRSNLSNLEELPDVLAEMK